MRRCCPISTSSWGQESNSCEHKAHNKGLKHFDAGCKPGARKLVHIDSSRGAKLRSAPSPLCSSCAVNMDEFTSAGFTTGIKMLKALVVGFVFTAIAFLSPRRSGNRTTPSHYGRRA